jgi:hypothetical protein
MPAVLQIKRRAGGGGDDDIDYHCPVSEELL